MGAVQESQTTSDGTRGQSRRGLYLPQGSKEPEAAYRQRLANARPSGFFPGCPADLRRDAGFGLNALR